MSEIVPPSNLGLNAVPKDPVPGAAELQFQKAEPIVAGDVPSPGMTCVTCKQPITAQYFHAQGQVVCPLCADRIQSGQQAPPALSLLRAAIYGAGAALGGCFLYATVSILTGLEFGLMAIVVGIMVGKTIRYASHGLGGRPQQILAVILTYFAITTSYIPVFISEQMKNPAKETQQTAQKEAPKAPAPAAEQNPKLTLTEALFFMLLLTAAAPFLALGSGVSGFISLFIIFIGLQQAWKLTGRTELLVTGPHEASQAQ